MRVDEIMVKEEPITDRSIHFLIPALSPNEPAHILSLPETFAIQQNPLEIPLPSGKYVLAPSPSELFHYYESVQPQMNSILSSSEDMVNHLTSENFIHLVENLSEYSIPCPVMQSNVLPSVDKSTSMISIDDSGLCSNPIMIDEDLQNSSSYETCSINSFLESSFTMQDDPNLFIHHERSISKFYPTDTSYLDRSSSPCGLPYSWASLPTSRTDSFVQMGVSHDFPWTAIHSKKKTKVRHSRKRTKFSSEDLEILNLFFDKNPMPSRSDISLLSDKLVYPRYIIQVWFYNKRQSLKRANSSSSQMDNFISARTI